jgi:hypothetical protein
MSEPIVIEYVGRVVEGYDGLEAVFDVEGGIAALEAGCSLFASVDLQNAALTDEDGSCEVFPIAEAVTLIAEVTKLRTQLERLQKRAWAVMQEALDSAEVHPCDAHSEDVKAKTLAPVYQDLYASLSATTIYVDEGKPGGDMTAKATFRNEGGKLTLESIEHREPNPGRPVLVGYGECKCILTQYCDGQCRPIYEIADVKACAASIGGIHCQASRADGSLFCARHKHASNRLNLPTITNESLAFMIQHDGEQQ